MTTSKMRLTTLTLSTALGLMAVVPVSHAFNFGNMMNPSRWLNGNNNDRHDGYYDDYYGGGPYGGGPYGGYGYPGGYGGPYGGMPYGMPGFGAPAAGYGAPAYGAPPAQAPAAQAAPTTRSNDSEVEALKRRIEELEARQQQNQRPQGNEWPSAPAFRPMNQY